MTPEEIISMATAAGFNVTSERATKSFCGFAALVAAHERENSAKMQGDCTLAEPVKQEPVATVNANDEGYWADILPDRDVKVGQLLYAAPVSAKREYVDLTDDEMEKAWSEKRDTLNWHECVRAVIAAFKEKNK